MDAISTDSGFQFQGFRLERHGQLFRADGTLVPLGSRALEVLQLLVRRDGQLVPKQDIMDAVWPGLAVEEANLTVQVSALRKALDAGRSGPSCIHTVPGRGYRFVWAVTRTGDAVAAQTAPPDARPAPAVPDCDCLVVSRPRRSGPPSDRGGRNEADPGPMPTRAPSLWKRWPVFAAVVAVLASAAVNIVISRQDGPANPPPRLSLVVLPFQSVGSDPANAYLADAITDDLTSDLSHIPEAKVIARSSARMFKDTATDARLIGRALDVRYVLHGSVRRVENALRVNAELVSAETGAQIWSDRFDEDIKDLNAGQHQIITRIKGALGISLVDHESARSARERPTSPDAFDLVLRARSIWLNPYNRERGIVAASLFERALRLDPSSVPAMLGLATVLLEQFVDGHGDADSFARAEKLVAQASAVDPNGESVLAANVFLLRAKGKWADLSYTAQVLIDRYPNNVFGHHQLANAKLFSGKADEAIAPLQTALRLAPRDAFVPLRYQKIALAMLLLGRFPEAIVWAQRYLTAFPDSDPGERCYTYLMIAASEAWSGHKADAERAVAEADRIWPFVTVRSTGDWGTSSPLVLAQLRRYQEGLRLAGLRDHADEAIDSGVAPVAELRTILAGKTPTTLPGVTTVTTAALAAMLVEQKPIVLDTVANSWGKSLPGAIGLRRSGLGGTFSDRAQERLRRKLEQLTGGDLARPIVVVGWNAERFDGHNLALRLATLGYRQVFWYRGGREAWEAAELQESELTFQDW